DARRQGPPGRPQRPDTIGSNARDPWVCHVRPPVVDRGGTPLLVSRRRRRRDTTVAPGSDRAARAAPPRIRGRLRNVPVLSLRARLPRTTGALRGRPGGRRRREVGVPRGRVPQMPDPSWRSLGWRRARLLVARCLDRRPPRWLADGWWCRDMGVETPRMLPAQAVERRSPTSDR